MNEPAPWWQTAVVYQIYPRSFRDADGDGVGDLRGVLEGLDHLTWLGVDALWLSPVFPSPMADFGYDVADYCDIDPVFGDLDVFDELVAAAHERGLKVVLDWVPNHTSDQHPWFQAALAAGPGSPERERFWFHPGLGPDGSQIPTEWVSSFQGSTWTRTTNPDGTPGEWYLHLFTPEQPDVNWNHPDVRAEHEAVLQFWFDRGVAGVRIDSAALLVKDPELGPLSDNPAPGAHPHVDRDEIHEIYRAWRRVADAYAEPRVLVGEVWLEDTERFAQYLRSDEMHTAFNFDFMTQPWDAAAMRTSIDRTLAAHAPVGAPATWVLSNHDVTRPVTRYGREDSSFAFDRKRFGTPTDLELGTQRARAAALLTSALPGCLYIYQGDELGLPEVNLPREVIEDPMHFRSDGVDPGRDGCRVPLPWAQSGPSLGFGDDAEPWLPQPRDWAEISVEAQASDDESMLSLYRAALALRRDDAAMRLGAMRWLELGDDVVAFCRGDRFASITNVGSTSIQLPPHQSVLLASTPLVDGALVPNSTVWLEVEPLGADGA